MPPDLGLLTEIERQEYDRLTAEYGEAVALDFYNLSVQAKEEAAEANRQLQQQQAVQKAELEGTEPPVQDITDPRFKLTAEQEAQFRASVKALREGRRGSEPAFPGITLYYTEEEMRSIYDQIAEAEAGRNYEALMGMKPAGADEARAAVDAMAPEVKASYNNFKASGIVEPTLRRGTPESESVMIRQERRPTVQDIEDRKLKTFQSIRQQKEFEGFPTQDQIREEAIERLQRENPGLSPEQIAQQADLLALQADTADKRARGKIYSFQGPDRARQAGDPFSMPATPTAFRTPGSEFVGGRLQRDPESIREMGVGEAMFEALKPQTIMSREELAQAEGMRDQRAAQFQLSIMSPSDKGLPDEQVFQRQEERAKQIFLARLEAAKKDVRQEVLTTNINAMNHPNFDDYIEIKAIESVRADIRDILGARPMHFATRDKLLEMDEFAVPESSLVAQAKDFGIEYLLPTLTDATTEKKFGELTESMGMAIVRDIGLPFRLINNPLEEAVENMIEVSTGQPVDRQSTRGQLYDAYSIDLTEEDEGYFPIDAYLKEVALETATGYTTGNAFAAYAKGPAKDPSKPDIGLDQQDQMFILGTAAELIIPYGTLLKVPGYTAKATFGAGGRAIGAVADASSLAKSAKGTPAARTLRSPGPIESVYKSNTYIAEKAADNIAGVEAAKDVVRARAQREVIDIAGDEAMAAGEEAASRARTAATRRIRTEADAKSLDEVRDLLQVSDPKDLEKLEEVAGSKAVSDYNASDIRKAYPRFSEDTRRMIDEIFEENLKKAKANNLTREEAALAEYDFITELRFADEPLEVRVGKITDEAIEESLSKLRPGARRVADDIIDKANQVPQTPDELNKFADDLDTFIERAAMKDDMYGDMARVVLREGGVRYGVADDVINPMSKMPGIPEEAAAPIRGAAPPVEKAGRSAASFEQLVEAGAERLARFDIDKYTALTDRMSVANSWMTRNGKVIVERARRNLEAFKGKYRQYFEGVSRKTLRRDVELQRIVAKADDGQALTAPEELYLGARILEMEALQQGAANRADLFFNTGVVGERIQQAPELRLKDFQPGIVAGSIATLAGELSTGGAIGMISTRNGRQILAEGARLGLNVLGVRRSPAQLINKAKEVAGKITKNRFGITEAPVYNITAEQQQMRQAVVAAQGEVERIEQSIRPTVSAYVKWAAGEAKDGNAQQRGLFQMMVQSQKQDPAMILTGTPPDTELVLGAQQIQDLGRITFGPLEAQDARALVVMAKDLGFVDEAGEVAVKTLDQYQILMGQFFTQNKRYAPTTAIEGMATRVKVPDDLVAQGLPKFIDNAIDYEGTFIVAAANGMARRRIERTIAEKLSRSSIRVADRKEAELILRTATQRLNDPITYNPYLQTRNQFQKLLKDSGYDTKQTQEMLDFIYGTGDPDTLPIPGIGISRGSIEDKLRAFYAGRDMDLYNQVRAAGLGNAEDPLIFAQQLAFTQETLLGDNFIGVVGANTRAELAKLKTMMGDPKSLGQLAKGFEQLSRPENQGVLGSAMSFFGFTLGDIRRSFVSGQLGGKYIPNLRYQTENIASAPFLAAITLDGGAASFMGARFANPTGARKLRVLAQQTPDAIIPGSLNITYKQAFDALQRYNIGSSNSALQLSDILLQDIKAIARADAAKAQGQYANLLVYAADDLLFSQAAFRSKKTSPYMKLAMDTDFYFREAMYFDQIRKGKTLEQAADIARTAFLDYGAMPPAFKKAGARGLLYLSFTYRTAAETLKALFKPNSMANLIKLSNFQRSMARYYGAYEYVGDKTLQSFFLYSSDPNVDYVESYFRNPWTANMMMYSQMVGFGLNVYAGDPETTVSSTLDAALDFFYLPVIDVLRDLDPDYKKGVPPKTMYQILQAQHMAGNIDLPIYHPKRFTMMLAREGGLPGESTIAAPFGFGRPEDVSPAAYYIERYDLEVRPIGSKVPGSATFSDYQYRFSSQAGYNNFRLDALLMATLGAQRMGGDATGALIAGGVLPPGSEFGYAEEGYPVLYLLGRETPIRVPKEWEVKDRQIRQAASKLKELEKSYGYKVE